MNQSINASNTAQEPNDLGFLLRVLRSHWLFITSLSLLITLLAALVAFSLTPIYTAKATLILESKETSVTDVNQIFSDMDYNLVYFETQRNLITSNELLSKVVKRLSLTDHDLFSPSDEKPIWQFNWQQWLPGYKPVLVELSADELILQRNEYALNTLKKVVSVEAVPRTELMQIKVMLADPEMAAMIVNELAQVYVESGLEARFDKAKSANAWVGDRLEELKQQLETSEKKLQDYLEKNQLTDVGGIRGLVEADIQENTANLLDAKKQVALLRNVVEKINAASGRLEALEGIQRLISDPVVKETRRDFQAAVQNQRQVSTRYGVKHPKYLAAEAAVDEASNLYLEQLRLVADNVKTEYQLAQQSVRDLRGFAAENKQQLTKLGQQSYGLRTLERDVELNRNMYDLFLEKMKETDISGRFDSVSSRIIDPAQIPKSPTEPRKKRIVILAFLMALFFGMGIVLLKVLFDRRVSSPSQYANLIDPIPVIATIPGHSKVAWRKGLKAATALLTKDRGFAEAMRTLRTNVQMTEFDAKKQILMIGSAIPAEGKTTISIGAAHSFSQIENVLLLETDLRKPTLRKRLDQENKTAGIVEYLLGQVEIEAVITKVENLGFDLLSVGAIPPNPQEMLQSAKFSELLDVLREKYDRIIVDTAPVLAVADAQLLAKQIDGVVCVAKAESSDKSVIRNAIETFNHVAPSKLIGGVLNGINTDKLQRYYGRQYRQYYEYYV